MELERTLVLVKHDGVARALIGRIVSRFEDAGLKIAAMKMVKIDKEFAKKHYAEHVAKPHYPNIEAMITEGPLVAMIIEGIAAISVVRKIVGATEPASAMPGTIRGDFAHINYQYADTEKIGVRNLIHASAHPDDAKKEISLWFKDSELFNYKLASEHVLFNR